MAVTTGLFMFCVCVSFFRNMHYPPETCSIMLIARIFAVVSQASDFSASSVYSPLAYM